jgi:acetyl-CoA carboxylase biotin carboxyl carrier protein
MPISIARLRALIDLAGSNGVDGIDISEDGTRIRITRSADAASAAAREAAAPKPRKAAASAADPHIYAAPMFGLLHLTPAPDAKPYVTVGQPVTKGQQLGLIEAMKLFSPIHSDREGVIEAMLAEPGAEVSQGQPLFRFRAG